MHLPPPLSQSNGRCPRRHKFWAEVLSPPKDGNVRCGTLHRKSAYSTLISILIGIQSYSTNQYSSTSEASASVATLLGPPVIVVVCSF